MAASISIFTEDGQTTFVIQQDVASYIEGLIYKLNTAEQERDQYKAAVENGIGVIEGYRNIVKSLRAQLKAAEGQEPVGKVVGKYDEWGDGQVGNILFIESGEPLPVNTAVYISPVPAQPSPAVAQGELIKGESYESGLWSMRSAEAMIQGGNVINGLSLAVAAPDGCKLVPKIPTTEMLMACAEAAPTLGAKTSPDGTWTQWAPNARWKAMVDAAPIAEQSPRITEQDARELAHSALSFWRNTVNLTHDVWIKDHAPALLNKLNNTDSVGG